MALAIRATAAHTAPSPTRLPPDSCPASARLPPDFCSSPARREGRSVLTVPDLPPPGRPTPAEGVRRRRASWREFLMDALARRGRSHSGIAHAPVAGAPRPQRGSFGIVFLSSLFFSVFACHSLPPALRRVGPARRGTVLCGSALKLSPLVKPAKWRTVCGTTSGGAREPGCRRTAHCRQRRFASSTAVSPILLRAESRRMGETAVDVAKVRSRSRTPRTHERAVPKRQPARSNSSWPRPPERPSTAVLSAPGLDDLPTIRTELPELHCVPTSEPHGTKRVSDPDPHSPAPCRSGTGLRWATTSPGNSARSRSAV